MVESPPGQSVTYTIERAGEHHEITLTRAPMPADVMARWNAEHMLRRARAEHGVPK